jgi:hypothetical protein
MIRNLILSFSLIFIIAGCTTKTVVKPEYIYKECAKFPIEEFKKAENYELKNLQVVDKNGTIYIQMEKKELLGFVSEYKKIKKNYNIILNNLEEFQTK